MKKSLLARLFDFLFSSVFTADFKGKHGETLIARQLKAVNFWGRKGNILRNLYVPKDNGETSEIDLIYVTQKGIFVFESKNYSGWIYGEEEADYWTVSLSQTEKYTLYNPIKQNRSHMRWLGNYIGNGIPLFSVIVFSERCELKEIVLESDEAQVIQRNDIYFCIRRIWQHSPDVLNSTQVAELTANLRKLTDVDKATRQAHIETIEKKYKNADPATSEQKQTTEKETVFCPRCGKPLVIRTATRGDYAGKQFYGCTGYPQCRYIQNIPDSTL